MRSSKRGQSTSWVAGSSASQSGSSSPACGETPLMKPSPSGRNQTPVVSTTSGTPSRRSRQVKLKTERRLASTGRAMPASAASAAPPAPAQLTSAPHGMRVASARRHGGDAVAVALDPRHRAGAVLRPERARLAAQGLQQAPAVEPALARAPERPASKVVRAQPRETLREAGRVEKRDIGPFRLLQRPVLRQDRGPGRTGDIQISALLEADLRTLAVDREMLADAAQESDAVKGDADVHGRRELLPDRGGRQSRGRAPVGRVPLDHEHASAKGRLGEKVVGDGRSHHGAAGDHHIEALHPAAS